MMCIVPPWIHDDMIRAIQMRLQAFVVVCKTTIMNFAQEFDGPEQCVLDLAWLSLQASKGPS